MGTTDFKQNASSVTLPAGVTAREFGASVADTYLENTYRGEQVVGIGDLHPQSDRYLAAAIEIASRTGKSLGLEAFEPEMIQVLDQVRAGTMTHEQYRQATENMSFISPQDGMSYLTDQRTRDLFEMLFTAAKSGIKIHSLQTPYGLTMGEGGNADGQLMLSLQAEGRTLSNGIDDDISTTIGQHNFSENPRAAYAEILHQLGPKAKNLPPHLAKEYKGILEEEKRLGKDPNLMNAPEAMSGAYITLAERLIKVTHPNTTALHNLEKRVDALMETAKVGDLSNFMPARLSGDASVAEKISQIIENSGTGMVVVYGAGHFNHGHNFGGDIDQNLRSRGISVGVVNMNIDDAESCYIPRGDAGIVEYVGRADDLNCVTLDDAFRTLTDSRISVDTNQTGQSTIRARIGTPAP